MKKTLFFSTLVSALMAFSSTLCNAQSVKMADPNPQNTAKAIVFTDLGVVDENTFKEANIENLGVPYTPKKTLYLLDGKMVTEKVFNNYDVSKIAKMEVFKDRNTIEKDFPKYKEYDVIIKLTSKK